MHGKDVVRTQASGDKKRDRKEKKADGKRKSKKLNKTGVEANRPSVPLLKITSLPFAGSSSANKAKVRDLSACKSSGRSKPLSSELLSPPKTLQRLTKAFSPEKKSLADVGIPKSLRQHLQNIITKQKSEKQLKKKQQYKSTQLLTQASKKRPEATKSPLSKKQAVNSNHKLYFSPITPIHNRDSALAVARSNKKLQKTATQVK